MVQALFTLGFRSVLIIPCARSSILFIEFTHWSGSKIVRRSFWFKWRLVQYTSLIGTSRVTFDQCCQLAEISHDIRPMLSVSRVTWHSTHVVIVVSLPHIWGWSDGTMTMMDSSPRVERFSTVTAGDGSATLLYAYHTKRCPSTSPLVFVNTTTMWDPDIYRWYMFAQRQN